MSKEPIYHEIWCTDKEAHVLTESLERVKDLEGDIIEIGCWEGRSAVHTANLIYPEILKCVDPWIADEVHAPYEAEQHKHRNIYETFLHNIEVETKGNVEVFKMGWREFFENYDGKIKYIYIDGPHGYQDVYDNIEIALPYMVPGGVMVGDDLDYEDVYRAVKDQFGTGFTTHPVSGRTWVYYKDKE